MDHLLIEPLSPRTVDKAIDLLKRVFPYEQISEPPEIYLRASLAKCDYLEALSLAQIPDLRYWVIVDEMSENVIGNTGLYVYETDKEIASWLGWTAVDVNYRGQGLGKKLINMMISAARSEGKKFMRIWTSTNPNETIANQYYAKLGFSDFRKPELIIGSNNYRRYLQLNL